MRKANIGRKKCHYCGFEESGWKNAAKKGSNFRNFVDEYVIEATRQTLDNEEEPIYPVLRAFMKSDFDQISMKSKGKASCDCGEEFDHKIRVRVE